MHLAERIAVARKQLDEASPVFRQEPAGRATKDMLYDVWSLLRKNGYYVGEPADSFGNGFLVMRSKPTVNIGAAGERFVLRLYDADR